MLKNHNLAPIVLFVYNRPEHTEKTLTSLRNNYLSSVSELFIYSDGPKSSTDLSQLGKINEVRELIRKKQWCGKVEIIESSTNLGLAASIRKGVTEVVQQYGKVIVLEDDLVTSPAFIKYMNDSLIHYENRKGVFSISGYCLPPNKFAVPDNYPYDVFVSLRPSSWGWGIWADRWSQIDWEVEDYFEIANDSNIIEALNRGGDDVFYFLEAWKSGKLDIWTSQFVMAHFMNHAVSILPVQSYVDNIGLDGSGENCGTNVQLRNNRLGENKNIRFLEILYEDKRLINSFYNAYCKSKRPLWKKILNRLSRNILNKDMYHIKKKIYV